MTSESTTARVRVDGAEVAVDVYGRDGPPVVLLHGIPGWRGTWRETALRLADRYRVYAPDLLGFGQSSDPDGDRHAGRQADALLRLLDRIGLDAAHVVGYDFGGPVALLAYRREPARFLSLSLAATNVFTDTRIPGPLRLAPVPVLGPLVFRAAFGRAGLSLLWRFAVKDRVAFPYARYREILRWPRGLAWTRRIFLASMQDLPARYREVEDTLSMVSVPGVVLWGDADPFFPVEVGKRTAAARRVRLIVLRDCGHFVPEERPDAVAAELRKVFAGKI